MIILVKHKKARALSLVLLLFLVHLTPIMGQAQTILPSNWDAPRGENGIRVVFYNIENLFDTINSPNTNDEEYLPHSKKEWKGYKYRQKINKISKVILASGGWELPDIVGVCEIENDTALRDLASAKALQKADYQRVHYNSPDRRGIDVALLYNPKKVTLMSSMRLLVTLKDEPDFRTRNILYAKFLTLEDTLHVYVNHWPSRRGGQQASEYKRIKAAQTLKSHIDSIQLKNAHAHILCMGDFNDAPYNNSIQKNLKAGNHVQDYDLIDLMTFLPESDGSHKYQGYWDYLDQIIVSPNFLENSSNLHLGPDKAQVITLEWLLKKDNKYPGYYPNRSWKGDFLTDGFSDHLPVYVDIVKSKKTIKK